MPYRTLKYYEVNLCSTRPIVKLTYKNTINYQGYILIIVQFRAASRKPLLSRGGTVPSTPLSLPAFARASAFQSSSRDSHPSSLARKPQVPEKRPTAKNGASMAPSPCYQPRNCPSFNGVSCVVMPLCLVAAFGCKCARCGPQSIWRQADLEIDRLIR